MSLDGFSILEGSLPDKYKRSYSVYLFHKPEHLALQNKGTCLHYFYIDTNKHKCLGEIHFHFENTVAFSPVRAPFGGFMLSNAISLQHVFHFVDLLLEDLKKRKIEKIIVKSFPELYDKQKSDYINAALIGSGFFTNIELSAIVDVQTDPVARMASEERRKMRICEEQGFVAKREQPANIETIYNVIAQARMEKGYKLSMTFPDLVSTVKQFEENFFLFGLYHREELVGGAITLAVDNRILYTFYYDSLSKFKKQSPAVLMLHRIYEFARRNQFEMVDLGTSMVDGKPLFTLLDFKRHIGAALCPKYTFEKILY